MKTAKELDPALAAAMIPLVDKIAIGGPIRWLAYIRLVLRMLRRWNSADFKTCYSLEQEYGVRACNEALAVLLGEAGILDTDGVYYWAKR